MKSQFYKNLNFIKPNFTLIILFLWRIDAFSILRYFILLTVSYSWDFRESYLFHNKILPTISNIFSYSLVMHKGIKQNLYNLLNAIDIEEGFNIILPFSDFYLRIWKHWRYLLTRYRIM